MKHLFYSLILLNTVVYGQLANNISADTNKVLNLNTTAWEFQYTNLDSAMLYGNAALELATQLKWKKGIAKSYSNLAVFYKLKGNPAKALQYNLSALQTAKELGNKNAIASILCNIGVIYNEKGAHPKALTHFFEALKAAESVNNQRLIGITLCNIGMVYIDQDNYTSALNYTRRSLNIAQQQGNKELQATSLGNIGLTYFKQRQYDTALVYYFKTLKLDEEMENTNALALHIANIASVYLEQGKYNQALDFYLRSLNMNRQIGNKLEEARALGNIGSTYGFLKNYKQAENYLQQALALANELQSNIEKRDFESMLSEVYEKKGDIGMALKTYKKYIATRDSIFNTENTKKQTQQEMQYEFDKQQLSEKAEQDKKDAIAIEEKQKQRLAIWLVSGGLLLVIVFLVFLYNRFKLTQKQKHIIETQKLQVDEAYGLLHEKNKEVMDSINYAERIQRSFLATKQLLDEHLENYFVLFQPKDVVSGDFYWAAKLSNGNFALATADSTGHGVPGAIMSLLNITSLERAIDQYTEPADILNATRKTIIERLKKDGSAEGGKDGMDASLTVYDFKNKKLLVAAANNPVWIVRHTATGETLANLPDKPHFPFEVIEIKPDKMPVGKHDKDNIGFTQQEIQLQSGDVVYTLTDGFPDQFGGERARPDGHPFGRGKKFMSKNLRELLAKNAHLPMQEQKQLLELSFKNWVGDLEQVDDVTIVGIKI